MNRSLDHCDEVKSHGKYSLTGCLCISGPRSLKSVSPVLARHKVVAFMGIAFKVRNPSARAYCSCCACFYQRRISGRLYIRWTSTEALYCFS